MTRHARAVTVPALGRQPDIRYHIPSHSNPWYGSIVEGDDLTIQQRLTLAERGMRQDVETITVRRLATDREMYWGSNPRPYYQFQCPVHSRRADGRIYVIAPSGERKLVHGDGWLF